MGQDPRLICMLRSEGCSAYTLFWCLDAYIHRQRLLNIAIGLAGPAAEGRLLPLREEDEIWLTELEENSDGQGVDDWDRLWEQAKMGGVPEPEAYRTVWRVAEWVGELLDIPRVWNLVEKLAGALKYGETMDGSDVAKLLEKEWGEGGSSSMPVLDLGRKWRRRFEVTREMMMKQMPQGYMPSIAERDQ